MEKLEFQVNNDVNVKVSLCHGDITKLNVDVIVNSVNKILSVGGGIDGAIHEAAEPGLVDECQKLNVCETGAGFQLIFEKWFAKILADIGGK